MDRKYSSSWNTVLHRTNMTLLPFTVVRSEKRERSVITYSKALLTKLEYQDAAKHGTRRLVSTQRFSVWLLVMFGLPFFALLFGYHESLQIVHAPGMSAPLLWQNKLSRNDRRKAKWFQKDTKESAVHESPLLWKWGFTGSLVAVKHPMNMQYLSQLSLFSILTGGQLFGAVHCWAW